MPPHVNVSERRFTLTYDRDQAVLWMGMGQVRDLRDRSIRAIMAGRPFSGVRDLLARVRLQEVEIQHLIQCGALDGLGANRADMLAMAREVDRAGSARQMAFSFAFAEAMPTAERIAWERHILGQPVSEHPLALAPDPLRRITLSALPHTDSQPVEVCAVRLPGWTGGEGFFIGDEDSYVIARSEGAAPRAWEPLLLQGRRRTDAWGGEWFQVQRVQLL
jgi:DNA polymerase III alpha subunit